MHHKCISRLREMHSVRETRNDKLTRCDINRDPFRQPRDSRNCRLVCKNNNGSFYDNLRRGLTRRNRESEVMKSRATNSQREQSHSMTNLSMLLSEYTRFVSCSCKLVGKEKKASVSSCVLGEFIYNLFLPNRARLALCRLIISLKILAFRPRSSLTFTIAKLSRKVRVCAEKHSRAI